MNSEQIIASDSSISDDFTWTVPALGKGWLKVNASGGTTGSTGRWNPNTSPAENAQMADRSIPRSKLTMKAPLATLACRPRPQAGARVMLLLFTANHNAPSGPAV